MRPDRGRDLDRELRDLGPSIDYPPVPDLARSVRGRLEAEAGSPGSPARSRPPLWWIAAAAIVLLVGVPVFSLAVREMGGGALSSGGGAVGGGGAEAGGGPGSGRQGADSTVGPSAKLEDETSAAQSEERDEASAGSGGEAADSALQAAKTPNDEPVPNVIGAPVLEACGELRARNYNGYVMGEVKSERVAPGHVVSQKPRVGRKGFQGQPVELIVSEPYPAGRLGRDARCYDLTEYGPGGKPNVPNNAPD